MPKIFLLVHQILIVKHIMVSINKARYLVQLLTSAMSHFGQLKCMRSSFFQQNKGTFAYSMLGEEKEMDSSYVRVELILKHTSSSQIDFPDV